ncbi:unnamed protein product [Caenorhabditis sp. 36 PRJEB53466]|nr:unnamed protein product [Caenorhabditis sp. 36 PRJEB53466]
MNNLAGSKISDKLKLLSHLGSGSYGSVYLAVTDKGTHVAAKLVRLNRNGNKDQTAEKELQFLESMSGVQGIPTLHGHGFWNSFRFFTMTRGTVNLNQLMTIDKIEPALHRFSVVRIAFELIGVIQAVHRRGWLHRDLKAENVMVTSDNNSRLHIMLVDFGLAERFRNSNGERLPFVAPENQFHAVIYCSVNNHLKKPSTEHDDLVMFTYLLAFICRETSFFYGTEKDRLKAKRKLARAPAKILRAENSFLFPIITAINRMRYGEEPDYGKIQLKIKNCVQGFNPEAAFFHVNREQKIRLSYENNDFLKERRKNPGTIHVIFHVNGHIERTESKMAKKKKTAKEVPAEVQAVRNRYIVWMSGTMEEEVLSYSRLKMHQSKLMVENSRRYVVIHAIFNQSNNLKLEVNEENESRLFILWDIVKTVYAAYLIFPDDMERHPNDPRWIECKLFEFFKQMEAWRTSGQILNDHSYAGDWAYQHATPEVAVEIIKHARKWANIGADVPFPNFQTLERMLHNSTLLAHEGNCSSTESDCPTKNIIFIDSGDGQAACYMALRAVSNVIMFEKNREKKEQCENLFEGAQILSNHFGKHIGQGLFLTKKDLTTHESIVKKLTCQNISLLFSVDKRRIMPVVRRLRFHFVDRAVIWTRRKKLVHIGRPKKRLLRSAQIKTITGKIARRQRQILLSKYILRKNATKKRILGFVTKTRRLIWRFKKDSTDVVKIPRYIKEMAMEMSMRRRTIRKQMKMELPAGWMRKPRRHSRIADAAAVQELASTSMLPLKVDIVDGQRTTTINNMHYNIHRSSQIDKIMEASPSASNDVIQETETTDVQPSCSGSADEVVENIQEQASLASTQTSTERIKTPVKTTKTTQEPSSVSTISEQGCQTGMVPNHSPLSATFDRSSTEPSPSSTAIPTPSTSPNHLDANREWKSKVNTADSQTKSNGLLAIESPKVPVPVKVKKSILISPPPVRVHVERMEIDDAPRSNLTDGKKPVVFDDNELGPDYPDHLQAPSSRQVKSSASGSNLQESHENGVGNVTATSTSAPESMFTSSRSRYTPKTNTGLNILESSSNGQTGRPDPYNFSDEHNSVPKRCKHIDAVSSDIAGPSTSSASVGYQPLQDPCVPADTRLGDYVRARHASSGSRKNQKRKIPWQPEPNILGFAGPSQQQVPRPPLPSGSQNPTSSRGVPLPREASFVPTPSAGVRYPSARRTFNFNLSDFPSRGLDLTPLREPHEHEKNMLVSEYVLLEEHGIVRPASPVLVVRAQAAAGRSQSASRNVRRPHGQSTSANVRRPRTQSTNTNVRRSPGPSTISDVSIAPGSSTITDVSIPPGSSTIRDVRRSPGPSTITDVSIPPGQTTISDVSIPPGPSTISDISIPPGPSTISDVSTPPGQTSISDVSIPPGQTSISDVSIPPGQTTISDVSIPLGPSAISDISIPPFQNYLAEEMEAFRSLPLRYLLEKVVLQLGRALEEGEIGIVLRWQLNWNCRVNFLELVQYLQLEHARKNAEQAAQAEELQKSSGKSLKERSDEPGTSAVAAAMSEVERLNNGIEEQSARHTIAQERAESERQERQNIEHARRAAEAHDRHAREAAHRLSEAEAAERQTSEEAARRAAEESDRLVKEEETEHEHSAKEKTTRTVDEAVAEHLARSMQVAAQQQQSQVIVPPTYVANAVSHASTAQEVQLPFFGLDPKLLQDWIEQQRKINEKEEYEREQKKILEEIQRKLLLESLLRPHMPSSSRPATAAPPGLATMGRAERPTRHQDFINQYAASPIVQVDNTPRMNSPRMDPPVMNHFAANLHNQHLMASPSPQNFQNSGPSGSMNNFTMGMGLARPLTAAPPPFVKPKRSYKRKNQQDGNEQKTQPKEKKPRSSKKKNGADAQVFAAPAPPRTPSQIQPSSFAMHLLNQRQVPPLNALEEFSRTFPNYRNFMDTQAAPTPQVVPILQNVQAYQFNPLMAALIASQTMQFNNTIPLVPQVAHLHRPTPVATPVPAYTPVPVVNNAFTAPMPPLQVPIIPAAPQLQLTDAQTIHKLSVLFCGRVTKQNAENMNNLEGKRNIGCYECKTPTSSKISKKLTRQNGTSNLRTPELLVSPVTVSPSDAALKLSHAPRKSVESGYSSDHAANQSPLPSQITTTLLITKKSSSTSMLEKKTNLKTPHLEIDYHLETIGAVCSTIYRRITTETLVAVMTKMSEWEFTEKYVLIDCRYTFEYAGGHVKHAVNFYDSDKAKSFFFDSEGKRKFHQVPIFYCEYSQKRGPTMASALRAADRGLNENIYPRCAYEEMYVLDGGFKKFFNFTRDSTSTVLCEPDNYVQMLDPRYSEELKTFQFHKKMSQKLLVRTSRSASSITLEKSTAATPVSTLQRSSSSVTSILERKRL